MSKLNFLFLVILLSSTKSSLGQEDFDAWRLRINETLGYYFNGSKRCEDLPVRCEHNSVTEGQPLNDLLPVHQHLTGRLTEQRFFEKAATEQFRFLSCDVKQLSAMTEMSERSMALQLDVIDEIYMKLPTLRALWAEIEPGRKRVAELRFSGPTGGGPRDAAYDAMTSRMIDEITANIGPKVDLFNTILASMWRIDDPLMQDFVMNAVISSKTPEQFRNEAVRPATDTGLMDRLMGRHQFSFREQVLAPMLSQASSDLNHLKRASMNGHGGGYRPSFMPMDLRQMLVTRSDYAGLLTEAGADGSREAAVFMCNMDRRYVSGAQAVNTVITGASMVIMAPGSAAGMIAVKRIMAGLAPETYTGLIRASTTWAIGGVAVATPVIGEQIKAQCFSSSPQYLLRSGSRVCDERNVDKFDEVQREQLQRENCALTALVVGGAAVPYFPLFVKYGAPALRNYLQNSRIAASLTPARRQRAAQVLTQVGGASAVTTSAQQVQESVETEGEEIVVVGRRPPANRRNPRPRNQSSGAR